jgi:2-polyprenyl-3-methyl-5-hydroxy-6-metoxy-1,4-benzoquinol methylase
MPAKLLDIGGGQMALLCKELFGYECSVGDISERYSSPIRRANIRFIKINLTDPKPAFPSEEFDVLVLLEVIEHIPLPAYIVVERIKPLPKSNGVLFLTTPNLFRLRNLVRVAAGVEFLDRFQVPQGEQAFGHQLEYSAEHLRWQLERAGTEVVMLKHDELGRVGHSLGARLGRKLLAPLRLRPIWRDALVAAARKRDAGSNAP